VSVPPKHRNLWSAVAVIGMGSFLAFSPLHAGILVSETFDVDGIEQYVGGGKILSAYVESGAGNVSVEEGRLRMSIVGDPDDGEAYAHIDLGSAVPLLSLQLDFTGLQYSAASAAWRMYVGGFDTISSFLPSWHIHGTNRAFAVPNVAGDNPYFMQAPANDGIAAGEMAGNVNETYTWSLYFNASGNSASYYAPDNVERTLLNNSWSMFINGVLVAENVSKGTEGGESQDLQGIIFRVSRNYEGGASDSAIDNIIIRDDLDLVVPEPGTAALLGLAGLLFCRRRRC
jgi:hypothetical protein